MFFQSEVIGAQSDHAGDAKADSQVENKDDRNSFHGGIEPGSAEAFGAKSRGRQGERPGGESYVADIEGQAEEVAEYRSEAKQVTENDAGRPASEVAIKNSQPAIASQFG